jgi:hypothetical protein
MPFARHRNSIAFPDTFGVAVDKAAVDRILPIISLVGTTGVLAPGIDATTIDAETARNAMGSLMPASRQYRRTETSCKHRKSGNALRAVATCSSRFRRGLLGCAGKLMTGLGDAMIAPATHRWLDSGCSD